jgi:hypothetical protein
MTDGMRTDVSQRSRGAPSWQRFAGIALIAGAIATIALNALFPRADDPSDVIDVLTTMGENELRQKVSFIAGTAGLWVVVAGIAGIYRVLSDGVAGLWARIGFYGVLAGVTLFTASTGLGLAATDAAVDWLEAGGGTTTTEFAAASAASALDDGVWAMSIIVLWTGLGLLGIAMLRSERFPRWLALPILVVGFANAAFAGVPLAYAGVSLALLMVFAALALLTSVWALVTGVWMLRTAP